LSSEGDFNTNHDQAMFAAERTLDSLPDAGYQNGFEGLALSKRVTHMLRKPRREKNKCATYAVSCYQFATDCEVHENTRLFSIYLGKKHLHR
jgi:hypothetical protein